jgi:hypothetical protein
MIDAALKDIVDDDDEDHLRNYTEPVYIPSGDEDGVL